VSAGWASAVLAGVYGVLAVCVVAVAWHELQDWRYRRHLDRTYGKQRPR